MRSLVSPSDSANASRCLRFGNRVERDLLGEQGSLRRSHAEAAHPGVDLEVHEKGAHRWPPPKELLQAHELVKVPYSDGNGPCGRCIGFFWGARSKNEDGNVESRTA